MPQKKTTQELSLQKRWFVAENRADGDTLILFPCTYEPSDSSSDSYSCAETAAPESEEKLSDSSSSPKTAVTFYFSCTCGHCNIMDTSK